MATRYFNKVKTSKKEARDVAMKLLVDCTKANFTVIFQADGCGTHLVAVVEKNGGIESLDNPLPSIINGWRVVVVFVPEGYIKVFYPPKRIEQLMSEA